MLYVLTRRLRFALLSALAVTLGVAVSSTAAPINGTLEFSVSGGMIDTGAHQITGGSSVVSSATGDFEFLQDRSIVLNSFDYQPFTDDVVLWDANVAVGAQPRAGGKGNLRLNSWISITATATSISVISESSTPNAGEVILAGAGTITADGWDATAMNWQMVATGGDDAILYVSFASEGDPGGGGTGSPPVPEPSAALCFAVGLLVVGRTLRKRR
jgi:hypothetical protein